MMIKTTSRTVLRRMLRDCDRKLACWDSFAKFMPPSMNYVVDMVELDARRREIRRRLKERRDAK